jgi:hypothetical protein
VNLKKIFFLLPFFIFLIIININCSDAPTPVKDPVLINPVNLVKLNSVTDSIRQTSSYYHRVIGHSGGSRILLGKKDNVEASFLIKFNIELTDTTKTDFLAGLINVTGSFIDFVKVYSAGDSLAPFDFTAHKINSSWFLEFTSDSLPFLSYDQNDIILNKTITDTINTIFIDNQLVADWLRAEADTAIPTDNGLYFKPTPNSQKITGFQAVNNSLINVPILNIIIEKPGVYIDTLLNISTRDLSVVTGIIPPVLPENIVIQAGYVINSKLYFDLSKIPPHATIHNAQLTLTLDTLETFPGDSSNFPIAAFIVDSTSDSVSTPTAAFSRNGSQFVADITAVALRWLIDRNYGLILRTADQVDGVELFSIKGSQANDVTLRPLLTITYSTLK